MKSTNNGRGQSEITFTLDQVLDQLYPVMIVATKYYLNRLISVETLINALPVIAYEILQLGLHDADKQQFVDVAIEQEYTYNEYSNVATELNEVLVKTMSNADIEYLHRFVKIFFVAIDRFQRKGNRNLVLSKRRIAIIAFTTARKSKDIDRSVGWTILEHISPLPEQAWDITPKRFPVPKELVESRYNFLGTHNGTEYGIIPIIHTDPKTEDVIIYVVNKELFEVERAVVDFDYVLPTEDEIFEADWV